MANTDSFLRWLEANEPSLPRSEPYPCPYLPDRQARQLGFSLGDERLDGAYYQALLDRGWRRTGKVFYRMECDGCRACTPLRVPVATFAPSRSQRRTWRRNQDLRVEVRHPKPEDDSYALYRRYLASQHPDSPQGDGEEDFAAFLYAPSVASFEVRYLDGDRLVGVSILDNTGESLSAVYHFFDPDVRARRLGVFSALREIELAREMGMAWYQLGYWIEGAKTMQYKAEYRPHEVLVDGQWRAGGAG